MMTATDLETYLANRIAEIDRMHLTDPERQLWKSRERDAIAILAMQHRIARNPLRELLWRKPWRSASGPRKGANLRVTIRNFIEWLRHAHDCTDPSVACTCYPSFRHPKINECRPSPHRDARC